MANILSIGHYPNFIADNLNSLKADLQRVIEINEADGELAEEALATAKLYSFDKKAAGFDELQSAFDLAINRHSNYFTFKGFQGPEWSQAR